MSNEEKNTPLFAETGLVRPLPLDYAQTDACADGMDRETSGVDPTFEERSQSGMDDVGINAALVTISNMKAGSINQDSIESVRQSLEEAQRRIYAASEMAKALIRILDKTN